jgi:hypothetical protein
VNWGVGDFLWVDRSARRGWLTSDGEVGDQCGFLLKSRSFGKSGSILGGILEVFETWTSQSADLGARMD